jgi:hypothetical protein
MFCRLLPLVRGALLAHPGLLLCCRRKFRSPLALAPGFVVLLARPARVRLGFLSMSGCLVAKTLALEATVLDRPSDGEQHQREHDQDAHHDGDHSDGGHVLLLPVASVSHARDGPSGGRPSLINSAAPWPGQHPRRAGLRRDGRVGPPKAECPERHVTFAIDHVVGLPVGGHRHPLDATYVVEPAHDFGHHRAAGGCRRK